MDVDQVNKEVRQALVQNGFRGTIDIDKAREIINKVTAPYADSMCIVTVEVAAIHNVGKRIQCDCARSAIRVEARRSSAKSRP